jgi:predicted histone-like DNA-binding protein
MPILIKAVQRGEPGVKGGGKKKYYPAIVTDGEVTIDNIVKEIEKFSALSEPDIRGVIIALENVIQDKLANSKIVRMDKIGSFYPTIHGEGRETAEEVNHKCVKSINVNYRPGARILKTMDADGFKMISNNDKKDARK